MEKVTQTIETKEIINQKNEVILSQVKRIKLLEDKLDEVRHKYFNLKMSLSFRGLLK